MSFVSLHGTAVYWCDMGILIIGDSGIGKSRLALELMDKGAELITDDVAFLSVCDGYLYASSDEKWAGCMEVRGFGIVSGFETRRNAKIDYVIELTHETMERMPVEMSEFNHLGVCVPLFKINKDEKFLPTLVKFAGKIVSKEVSLIAFDENLKK